MPVFEDQQAVQQLLTGINTMQMQAGLMPGGIHYQQGQQQNNQNAPTPGEFSNNLRVNYAPGYTMPATVPVNYTGVSPVPRNDMARSILPGSMLGTGWGMARQSAQASNNEWLSGMQGTAGLAGRVGLGGASAWAGGALGMMVGGPPGAALGALALPYATDMLMGGAAESMATLPFRRFIHQRQNALTLQNSSMNFLRTGSETAASGMGLTMNASMDLERNLSQMSGSRGFRRDTNNMFNRQDLMRLTQLSSQVGMLDNAQSVDQITREVGRISRALSTFMRVVDEPDVQQALQMMGRMRNLGMGIPEMNTAAANARTFARMAGVSVQNVLEAGMQGARTFQNAGLSGAAGLQSGMASQGAAGALSGMLTPRQLSMLGGREGVAQNLTQGAANLTNIDMMLPGMLRQGRNGLEVDTRAMLDFAQGRTNANDLARNSARMMSGVGGRQFMEEWSTRRNELRDQFVSAFGGQGAMLAPMMMAQAISSTGATDFRGGLRMQGLNEEQARTYELAYRSPDFFRRLREQQEVERTNGQADVLRGRRNDFAAAQSARTRSLVRQILPEGVSAVRALRRDIRDMDRFFQENFGESQDVEEEQQFLGGGNLIGMARASRYGTEEQIGALRQTMRTEEGRRGVYGAHGRNQARRDELLQQQTAGLETQNDIRKWAARTGFFIPSRIVENFWGEEGFGFTEQQRGGEGMRRTVMRNEDFGTRVQNWFGYADRTQGEIQTRAENMMRGGQIIERAQAARFNPQRAAILQRESGVDQPRFDQARARAAAVANRYAHSLSGGWWTSNNKGFNIEAMRSEINADLRRSGMSEEEVRRLTSSDSFMEEAVRLGSFGRDERTQAVFQAGAAAGGELGRTASLRTQNITQQVADESRKRLINTLGIDVDDVNQGQARSLVNLMSEEGPEADARRAMFQVRALRATGTETSERRAALLTTEVERSGLTPEQIAAAEAAAGGLADTLDQDVLRDVGTAVERRWGDRKQDSRYQRRLANEAREGDLALGLVQQLGAKGAAAFERGQAAGGSGIKSLQSYLEGSGGKLEGGKLTDEQIEQIRSGKMDASQVEGLAMGDIRHRAQAAVEGAHTQTQAGNAGQNELANQLLQALEQQAGRDTQRMQQSFGRFDSAVDKFTAAADTLTQAAGAMTGKSAEEVLERGRAEAKKAAAGQSLSSVAR